MLTACHILNRVLTKGNKKTTNELWYLHCFRVLGCRSIVKVPKNKSKENCARGLKCISMDYAKFRIKI